MALSPKRVKYRKYQRMRWNKGYATRGNRVVFGDMGLMSLEWGEIKAKHMEAIRLGAMRVLGGAGRIYLRVFPWKPKTAKPQETGLGKGKGEVAKDGWCCPVKPGKIIIELAGASPDDMKTCLRRLADKLPVKTKLVLREGI